jgi:drug/metabolite transporter (DMT)-like permease
MSRRALVLFILMCFIWGIPYLFIRIAVSELHPSVLVLARTGIGALILLPIALARRELRGLASRWLPLVTFAVIEIGVPWLMLSNAEQHISSSLAGLLVSAVPLVATISSPLLGKREHLGPVNLGGLFLGMAGVAAIVGFDLRSSGALPLAEMALVAIGYAVAPIILSRYLADLPPVGVIAVALALCAVVYAPVAALQWPQRLPDTNVLVAVLVLAVVATALGFVLFFALIAEIGPVRATVITYVNPAVAALLGMAVLHEAFTPGMAVGFVLVLLGSALATRRRQTEAAPEVSSLSGATEAGGPR